MRNHNPAKRIARIFSEPRPLLRYDGSISFDDWQTTARKRLYELPGLVGCKRLAV